MEQTRYWMWTKRKHSLSSHLQLSNRSSYDDSWEEQAFAEDAAGTLGGCIWPPRSYSCSFCRREFRSAQALGGHMNVHRRDRARLKQSPPLSINNHEHQNQNNHLFQSTYSPLGFQYPSRQICALVYSPNPNSSDPPIFASQSSPSKVLATPTIQPNSDDNKDKKESLRSSPSSWPNISDPTGEKEKNLRIIESGCRANKVDYFKRTCPDGEDKEEAIGCKRRRTTASSLPFIVKSDSVEIGPCSLEELDLELRLGERPKVN